MDDRMGDCTGDGSRRSRRRAGRKDDVEPFVETMQSRSYGRRLYGP
jgi:hypothetical protein